MLAPRTTCCNCLPMAIGQRTKVRCPLLQIVHCSLSHSRMLRQRSVMAAASPPCPLNKEQERKLRQLTVMSKAENCKVCVCKPTLGDSLAQSLRLAAGACSRTASHDDLFWPSAPSLKCWCCPFHEVGESLLLQIHFDSGHAVNAPAPVMSWISSCHRLSA